MKKHEIYEMVIREMTENALRERRKLSTEEQWMQKCVNELSKKIQKDIKLLPLTMQKNITEYIETSVKVADHECAYLYVQGAKDCVELLKKLRVL